jgi:predicted RNase H-like HicB family nuclease
MKRPQAERNPSAWPTREMVGMGRSGPAIRFIYNPELPSYSGPASNAWTSDVDYELSLISDILQQRGVEIAVQQSRSLEDQLRAAFESPQKLNQLCEAVERLETKIDQLQKKLDETSSRPQSIMVPIETLAPEPYDLLRAFTAVITRNGEEFVASLFDASVFASGDTEEDAVANLKDTLIDTYEMLNELGDDRLGPGPLRQKQILNELIRKAENK